MHRPTYSLASASRSAQAMLSSLHPPHKIGASGRSRWHVLHRVSRAVPMLALALAPVLSACGGGDPTVSGSVSAGGGGTATQGAEGRQDKRADNRASVGAESADLPAVAAQARGAQPGLSSPTGVPPDLLPPNFLSPLAQVADVSTRVDLCTTRWRLLLHNDGRLHVSKSAERTPIEGGEGAPDGVAPVGSMGEVGQWVEPLRIARFVVSHVDVTRPLLTLVDEAGTGVYRMSLEPSTCGSAALAADPSPVPHHTLAADQTVASLKVLSNADRQTRAVLRTRTGAWLEDDGRALGLSTEVVDFVGADPALQSAYIDNARLFVLRQDGRVQRLPTGPQGPIEFFSGLSGVRQLSGDGFAVFARTESRQVFWVNPDEAGADPDPTGSGSLPADPSALPVSLAIPLGGACGMADTLLIACRNRNVLQIRSVVHGTSSQTGAFLVEVAPQVEDLGIGPARSLGDMASLTMMGSLVTGARAEGVWIQTFDGRTLDRGGQPVVIPAP